MNLLHLPWLELAIAIPLVGSPFVSRLRDPDRACRWGLVVHGARPSPARSWRGWPSTWASRPS